MLVARTFEKNLRFEEKLEDEFEFEKTLIWWHNLVRKTQIFWEISDMRKSQRWWPRGQRATDLQLFQNHWANFNQTWHNASLGDEDASLFKWRTTPIIDLHPTRIFSQIWYFSENLHFYHQTVPPNIFFPKLEKIFELVAPRPKFEFFSKTVPPN